MRTAAADARLGARIRAVRIAKGVSLRGLARMIGISPATLSLLENGRTRISVARLGEVADALGVPVAHILDVASPDAPTGADRPSTPAEPHPATRTTGWRVYGPLDFDPVLRAALDEFVAIGYHGATVRGIAARAGLSVSGIYHYHASKQQMLVKILDYTMTDLLDRSHAALAEGRNAVERFSFLIENLALHHTYHRELAFIGASEMRSFDPENRRRIADMRRTQQRLVDQQVEQAVAEGHFRADYPYEAARAVVTMCTALATWWRPTGPYSPEQIAEQYVRFALDLMSRRD